MTQEEWEYNRREKLDRLEETLIRKESQLEQTDESIQNNEEKRERLFLAQNNVRPGGREDIILDDLSNKVSDVNMLIESKYEKREELRTQIDDIQSKIAEIENRAWIPRTPRAGYYN